MNPRKEVLIVEDESLIAMAIEFKLKQAGWPVCGRATSGEEAVEKVRACLPGLLLMDIRLAGDLDGLETIRVIREFSTVPVVFMTGYQDPTTKRRALELNPLAFLEKPLKLMDLEPILTGLLNAGSLDSAGAR